MNHEQVGKSDAFLGVLVGKNILQNKILKGKDFYGFCFLLLTHIQMKLNIN